MSMIRVCSQTIRSSSQNSIQFVFKSAFLVCLCGLLSACFTSKQIRTDVVEGNCVWDDIDCSESVIQKHPQFDLAFIEFTERGNLFNRSDTDKVYEFVNREAISEKGAAVFVFVHGWKHNAEDDDSNVVQFKEFLARAAENEVVGQRKVIGIYLGWRGDITTIPGVRNLSYWSRKNVAEEVGQGGATEVFTRLHQILVAQFSEAERNGPLHKNNYVLIGHSFGGAIIVSALHDLLLRDLIGARPILPIDGIAECKKVNRFADALVLLNPAIEANKVIQLKEASARCQFGEEQPKLMHVLSSEADNATQIYFPLGQGFRLIKTLVPKILPRMINNRAVLLDESQLNNITVGNLEQIRTGYMFYSPDTKDWEFKRCRDGLDECGVSTKTQQDNYIWTRRYDPLVFIQTDKKFIRNHNDVFGCYVQSYITAIIFETQSIDTGYLGQKSLLGDLEGESQRSFGCSYSDFSFKQCFNNQLSDYDCELP